MKLYSTITKEMIRKRLMRGSLISGFGASIALLAGVFIPVETLKSWGIFIWSASIVLIAWGYIPYKFLDYLSMHPNSIEIDDAEILHYHTRGEERLTLPLSEIKDIEYNGSAIVLITESQEFILSYFSKKSFYALRHAFQS